MLAVTMKMSLVCAGGQCAQPAVPCHVTSLSLCCHCLPKQDLTPDDHRLQQTERKAPSTLPGAQAGDWCFATRVSRCPHGCWGHEQCLWQELPHTARPAAPELQREPLQIQLNCDPGNIVVSTVNWKEEEEKLSLSLLI